MNKAAIRIFSALLLAGVGTQSFRLRLGETLTATGLLIACVLPVSFGVALILMGIKYRQHPSALAFPTITGPIMLPRVPLQDEYDSGLIVLSVGVGALAGSLITKSQFSVEGACAVLWSIGVFAAIRVFVSRRHSKT